MYTRRMTNEAEQIAPLPEDADAKLKRQYAEGVYSPKDKYLWDAWFVQTEDEWHMFHLQSINEVDPLQRHHYAEIGHAVSKDCIEWEEMPVALEPDRKGKWDDLALWTGSIIEKDGIYYMFYTGRGRANFWGQYVGLATSTDLKTWERCEKNPVLRAGQYYCDVAEGVACNFNSVPAWRDPYVFYDVETEQYCMALCARLHSGENMYNGAVGLATSQNLIDWELQPALLAPNRYAEMEVPQVIVHNDKHYLFFSTWDHKYDPEWKEISGGGNGLHCYMSDSLRGEYVPVNGNGVVFSEHQSIYAPRIIQHYKDDQFVAIGWLDGGWQEGQGEGQFVGRLSYPFLVELKEDSVSVVGFLDPRRGETTPEHIHEQSNEDEE